MTGKAIPGILCLGVLLASLGAAPVRALSEGGTPSPAGDLSITPVNLTDTPSPTPSPSESPTQTPTPSATGEPSLTAEPLETPTPDLAETSPPDPTQTLSHTATENPSATATATMTPTELSLDILRGQARYQSHLPDQAGITIAAFGADNAVLGSTGTDAKGRYELAIPALDFLWLAFDAPLHQLVLVEVGADTPLPERITLRGGDIDGDGCINNTDLALVTAHFAAPDSVGTDINGDAQTDLADLAILSGNFNPECVPAPDFIIMPTPTVVSTDPAAPPLLPDDAAASTGEP